MRCREKKYTLDGWYCGKHEDRQRYRCSTCGRRFWDNLGLEYRQVPRPYTTPALIIWCGVAANTQMTLRHPGRGARGRHNRNTGTPFHYSKMMGEYAERLKSPCVGDGWGCNEKMQKVRGKGQYIVAGMEPAVQFVLAWDVTPAKYDAALLLRKARGMAPFV